MQHLNLETLARLVDEPPAAAEAEHLESCGACRAELDALRADIATLAVLPPIAPPDSVWQGIERRARADGLIEVDEPARRAWAPALLKLAASVMLFAGGAAAGATWTGGGPAETQTADVAGAAPTVDLGTTLLSARQPRSPAEAAQLLEEAEAIIYYALARSAEFEPPTSRDDMIARLATLESITSVTGMALDQAPADPIINGYHLSALAHRDATLRRIAVTEVDSW